MASGRGQQPQQAEHIAQQGTVPFPCVLRPRLHLCSATKDATVVLSAPIRLGLDECLEHVIPDELVEVRRQHSAARTCSAPTMTRCWRSVRRS